MAQAYRSALVVTPDGSRPGAMLVEGGMTRAICNDAEIPADMTVIDCGEDALLPGLIDAHVHTSRSARSGRASRLLRRPRPLGAIRC